MASKPYSLHHRTERVIMAWVCSCNALNTAAVNGAIAAGAHEPHLRPSQIYRQLGVKPQCGRCSPEIRDLIAAARQTTAPAAPHQEPTHQTPTRLMPEPLLNSPSGSAPPAPTTSPPLAASPPTGCTGCIKAQLGQCARQLTAPTTTAERPPAAIIIRPLLQQAAR